MGTADELVREVEEATDRTRRGFEAIFDRLAAEAAERRCRFKARGFHPDAAPRERVAKPAARG